MTTQPNRVDAGVPAGGQFATKPQSDEVPALTPAAPAPAVIASVDLQQWQNDYAVTVETVTFDSGPILARMSPEERGAIEDNSENTDELYREAVRRGLVKEHKGPFSLWVQSAIENAEEQDAGIWDKLAGQPHVRAPEAVLDTPLTPYELGVRAGSDGWVEGLATFDMEDLIGNDLESHGDQIGEKLVGSELLMDVSAKPVSVDPDGSIICRLSGDASEIIDGFDDDERAEYDKGRAQAGWTD